MECFKLALVLLLSFTLASQAPTLRLHVVASPAGQSVILYSGVLYLRLRVYLFLDFQ